MSELEVKKRSFDRAYADYMCRCAEFRSFYGSRHDASLMDVMTDSGSDYSFSVAAKALTDLRVSKNIFELVSDDVLMSDVWLD